jgi:sialate O-acetylesterase
MSLFSTPTVLYNDNIAPLTQLAVKGFIWYQGESNVSRAAEYRELFPALIRDWRTRFNQGDLPFLFVQLANYLHEVPEPAESRWAELREAQAAALKLANTGMAVTIDIGDAYDIHPKNKMDVGKRLGLAALHVACHRNIVCTGPAFGSAEMQGNRVVLHFETGTGPLISRDKYGYVRGFAVAGSDRKFHWARAFIEGNDVIVTSAAVKEPVAVRYAWSDNPGPLDLYNRDGLPAAPFRTDSWPLTTDGKVYSDNPWENE